MELFNFGKRVLFLSILSLLFVNMVQYVQYMLELVRVGFDFQGKRLCGYQEVHPALANYTVLRLWVLLCQIISEFLRSDGELLLKGRRINLSGPV